MRNLPHTGDLFSIHRRFDERRSPRRQLCSQFGIMSHVFGSRSTICQYKGVTRGSLHTNSGAEQLVILNTRNPLETHGPPLPSFLRLVLSSPNPPPSSSNPPRSSVLFHHPVSIPRRDLDIMLDKLAIQSNTIGYTTSLAVTVERRINLSILWKLIKPCGFRANQNRLEVVQMTKRWMQM